METVTRIPIRKLRRCEDFATRLKGLLFSKPLEKGEACLLRPCHSIHTFGMSYAIDAYFLDKHNRVIWIIRDMKPNRVSPVIPNAASVLEVLPDSVDFEIGHKLELGESGQAAIEYFFSLLFLVAFCFVLTDGVKVAFKWAWLQYAVNEGARYGSIGAFPPGVANRELAISEKVKDVAKQLGVDGVNVKFLDVDGRETSGGPSDFFRLRAESSVTLHAFPESITKLVGDHSGNFPIKAETIIKNEPFD